MLALLAGVTAAVVASRAPSFLSAYPRCRDVISDGKLAASAFAVYQVAYGMVFVSGEAFWRGYILFGLERQLGRNALFFMIIPYVVGHFGKPPLETFGAVVAGLLLGYLALRHRSFWLGVVVHWGVAIAMDIAALVRSGVTLTWN